MITSSRCRHRQGDTAALPVHARRSHHNAMGHDLHAVWTLPEGDDAYSLRWTLIKRWFSTAVPHGEDRSASRTAKGERGIWQRRFWEHTVRDDGDFARCVDYVHFNPVKHGLARSAADWPYSSFRQAAARGWYPVDCVFEGEDAENFGDGFGG